MLSRSRSDRKDAEFRGAESRLAGVGCRFLYLHATWVHTYNASHSTDAQRTKVFVCDNGYAAFSQGLTRACELMGYELVADAVDADLVFLYVAPPSELRCGERSQYELFERVREHSKSTERPVNDQPMFCALLGDAAFLEAPKEGEAERLRGLSDFAISQQMRPVVESAAYETVAQFAVEFVPAHTANLSDDFKAEKAEQLSGLMSRFGVLDKNMMHHTEKWELLAPAGSAFCHAQDDARGVTQVGAEEAAYWTHTARRHACDQCLLFTDKLAHCSRCHEAVYCSRDCQKAAWKLHKRICAKPT